MSFRKTAVKTLGAVPGVYSLVRWWKFFGKLRLRVLAADFVRALAPKSSLRWGAPREPVRLLKRLRENDPGLKGRIVMPGQTPSPLPPDSMQVKCKLNQHRLQPWPIFWTFHERARLVGKSLALALAGKQIALESVYGMNKLGLAEDYLHLARDARELKEMERKAFWVDPACLYLRLPEAARLDGNWTSIVSAWVPVDGVPNYSHWLLDALPRLGLLEEFPADTKIIIPERLAGYQKETIEMLGLTGRVRYTGDEHLEVENYYFSSPVSMVVCDSPYSVDFLRKKLLPHASKNYSGPRRFIIDREGPFRVIANREEFNRFFEDLGWAILKPENLSFADEMKLFADADAICGILGSGFTNAIWCKPGCAVIQILPDNLLDGSTEWICMHNQLRWRYLVCPGDERLQARVDLGALKAILRELGVA